MSSELIVKMLELYEVVVPILEKEGRTVSYASSKWNLANWPNYEGEEELEKWIDTVYSENWFTNSTSNIQRLLKISNEVITGNGSNGVKRGLWVHSKHIKELGTALNTNFDGVQRLSDDASKLIQSIDPEDPLGKHRLEQLSLELRYLSDEIDRRLK